MMWGKRCKNCGEEAITRGMCSPCLFDADVDRALARWGLK